MSEKKFDKEQNITKSNTRQNGRKKDYRRKGRADKMRDQREDHDTVPNTALNDRDWYKVTDRITDSIASIPFNRFPGKFEATGTGGLTGTGSITTYVNSSPNSTPGVLEIAFINAYGSSGTGSGNAVSALNIASKALYTWVRHQNSGHTNYEAADLMLYILAMDEVYTQYFMLKRLLAIANTYDLVNRNIPDLLIEPYGVNIPDLRANIAQYRGKLNLLAAKISSMAVPNMFNIFKRHTLLTSAVFADSDSARSQFYMFMNKNPRIYVPNYDTHGGGLAEFIPSPAPTTAGDYLNILESLIDVIISDDDMNIMSGDILKAYGRENLFVIQECDATETVPVVMDEDVLQQIENAMAVSGPYAPGSVDVHQLNGSLIEEYAIVANANAAGEMAKIILEGDVYFNSHKEEVSSDDVLEWSRLMIGATYDPNTGNLYLHPGSELVVGYRLHHYTYNASGVQSLTKTGFGTFVNMSASTGSVLLPLDKFDWHPFVYVYNWASPSGTSITYSGMMGDLKKYTLIDGATIRALNDVAVMGELGSLVVNEFNRR